MAHGWKLSLRLSGAGASRIAVVILACAMVFQTGCQDLGNYRPPTWLGSFRPPRPGAIPSATASKPLSSEQKADVQFAFARNAEMQGELEVAMQAYQITLDEDDSRGDVCHRLALLHERKGDMETADAYYTRALECSPEDSEIHCDLGYSLYLRGQLPEAETRYVKALQLRSDFLRAHINYGLLLARTGREEAALHEFFKAGISERQARLNLAAALILENKVTEAKQQIQLARHLDTRGESSEQIAQMERFVVAIGEPVPPHQPESLARRLPEATTCEPMTRR